MATGEEVSCAPLPLGGYDCEFQESPPECFECPVCLLVLREPHLLSCCGVKICQSCISGIQERNGPCPKCRKESFITLLDKELERGILALMVKCSLGCPWVGELRHLERHVSSSDEGDCPLVEVSCRHGCGLKLKRAEEKNHEEEECSKRPIEYQLTRLKYHTDQKLTELKKEYDKQVDMLKQVVEEQKQEIAKLKQKISSSHSKSESVCTTLSSLKPDVLQLMPKLPVGNIPGVQYDPLNGIVEVYGSCSEEVDARCWQFRIEYQKMVFAIRSKTVNLPTQPEEQKLEDFIMELNLKYPSSYVIRGSKQVLKILSVLPSQADEIARLLESKLGSMKITSFQLSEKRRVILKQGDIAKEDADILVNATNRKLVIENRGVASALNKASNGELKKHTAEYLSTHGPLESGDVIVTSGGGNLKCTHVFHFAGPTSSYNFSDSFVSNTLQKGIDRILAEAEKLEAVSIAIPAAGAGSYLLKNEVIASVILHAIKDHKFSSDTYVTDIRIVVFNTAVYPSFVKAFSNITV